jgi:TatD DNase family protein
MKIIETHFHLDYLKALPVHKILKNAKEVGVEKFLSIAVAPENLDKVKDLSEEFEEVYFTQGIHPHDAKEATVATFETIRSRCDFPKMLAVGEIGLDYHYNHSPHEIQKTVFKTQLQIAIDNNLPVVIHSRDADEDMMQILRVYAPKMEKKGVIHSFTSSPELAICALDLGFYIGFNGIITFKNAKNVRDIVETTPIGKILVETDSPFLTPIPHRGKENSPANLPFIIDKISEIKDFSSEEVANITYQNAIDLFGF